MGDTVKKCKLMRSCLDAVFEITKVIKKSPKRDAMFQKLKHDFATGTPNFCVLCPTRRTLRTALLQSVLDHYEVLLGVWEESKNSQIDMLHQSEFDIDAPTLSRKRCAPRRLQIGLTDDNFHSTPEVTTGRFTTKHLILLLNPLTADSINLGIKFIAML